MNRISRIINRPGLKLSHKLGLSFALLLLLLFGLTALALVRMNSVSNSLNEVAGEGAQRSRAIRDLDRSANQFGAIMRNLPSSPADTMVALVGSLSELASAHTKSATQVAALIRDPQVLAMLDEDAKAAAAAQEVFVLARKESGDRDEVAVAFSVRLLVSASGDHAKWNGRLQAWSQATSKLSAWDDEASRAAAERTAAVASSARWVLIVGAAFALLLAASLAWWITTDVDRGLKQATTAARRMAQYDLSVPVQVTRQDELGELLTALEEMRVRQHALASGVIDAAQSIQRASSEIASGSHEMSDRTEQAASTLQGVASTITLLADSVNHTSDSAHKANELTAVANHVAQQGEQTVAQAVATMAEVDESSKRIVDIISMIDGVAFQTNILALNAAVEAARAGEQGRGFAVVASEVRALAGRSSHAAREVRALIQDSRDKVAAGSEQVHKAGSSTQDVLKSVNSVAQIVTTISRDAAEQLSSINDARDSVTQLEHTVQQNAVMAEETAAATSSLNEQASRLVNLTASFKLGD